MNKKEVKAIVVSNHLDMIKHYQESIKMKRKGADINSMSTPDPEDLSHNVEYLEVIEELEGKLYAIKNELNFLKDIPLDEKDKIVLGSLVITNHLVFYIGVMSNTFELEGKTVVGISTNAPIYSNMLNKKVGESFSFRDRKYEILDIS